jgi:hypothetical protein
MNLLTFLRFPFAASICVIGFSLQSSSLSASFVSVANPGLTSKITAQIVWTDTGLQGSISDPSSKKSSVLLNPTTDTYLGLGSSIAFLVAFDRGSGAVSLSVDFNRDGTFSSDETVTISPSQNNYIEDFRGKTFEYVSVSVRNSWPARRIGLSDLGINDSSFGAIRSGKSTRELFFHNAALTPATEILVSGNLMLSHPIKGSGRSVWKIDFISPITPSDSRITVIPEPMAGSLFLLGGIALVCGTRRLRSR